MGGRLHSLDLAALDAAPDGQVVKKIAGLWVAADEGLFDVDTILTAPNQVGSVLIDVNGNVLVALP